MAPHSSTLENPMDGGAWWAAVHGVAKNRTRLSDFTFTFQFHALEKEVATHSSVLAWRIPGTGEHGGLLSMGSHRVRHDWSDLAAAAAARGNLDSLAFVTLEHRVGLAAVVGVCGSLLREIEGQHVRCHFEHVSTPKGAWASRGPSGLCGCGCGLICVEVYCKGCVLWCATNLWFSRRCITMWKHLQSCGWTVNATKIPSLKGWPRIHGGFCRSLKTLQKWGCLCGGFPAISQGQIVDWTWPWKIRHSTCSGWLF